MDKTPSPGEIVEAMQRILSPPGPDVGDPMGPGRGNLRPGPNGYVKSEDRTMSEFLGGLLMWAITLPIMAGIFYCIVAVLHWMWRNT